MKATKELECHSQELPLCLPERLNAEFAQKVEEYRLRMEICIRDDLTTAGPLSSHISGEIDVGGRHGRTNYYRDAAYKYTIGKHILNEGILDIDEARRKAEGLEDLPFDDHAFRNAVGVFRSYFTGKRLMENRLSFRSKVYTARP